MKNTILTLWAILAACMYSSREWIEDIWVNTDNTKRWIYAALISIFLTGSLAWALAPIVWQWSQYLQTL